MGWETIAWCEWNEFGQKVLKHHFPKTATLEFLLVDLVNNLDKLAEDRKEILDKVLSRTKSMDAKKLTSAVRMYGDSKTQKLLMPFLNRKKEKLSHAA